MYALNVKPVLSIQSDFTVAVATVHWFVSAWLERYLGFLTTLSTNRGKHLALGFIAIATVTVSIALCFPRLAAFGTTFGLIRITLGLVKLLILSAVSESDATIGTLECFVLKTHWMTEL